MENMDGVTLVSHDPVGDDPLVRDLRSEVDAAWEEHAAKKSRKASPDKPQPTHLLQSESPQSPPGNLGITVCKFFKYNGD